MSEVRKDSAREDNPLGSQPIGKLMLNYAVPSVISMLVMSLYNIVDQIFIGRSVGYLGNSATTVAFPITTIALSLSLLIGVGSAAFISLEMGRGNTDRAQKILGNALSVLTLMGLGFLAIVLLFLRPILTAFGATELVMPYAMEYTWIIMFGVPLAMISTAMSHLIRVDGSPRYSMFCNLVGAGLNIILDPILIFGFGWGVKGAAVATVISQIVSFALSLYYVLRRARFIRLEKKNLRPEGALVLKVMGLGSSSALNQAAMTVLNIVMNNSLRYYGAASAFGSEVPLAAMGVVMKVSGIMISIIVGIAVGAQPILGYNYGARNVERVKRTYWTTVIATTIISTVCNILFLLIPETIVGIFDKTDSLSIGLAAKQMVALLVPGMGAEGIAQLGGDFVLFSARAMRIFLCCVFAAGIQIPSSSYFQAVGKPLKSTVLTMTRQIIFLVPLLLLLPIWLGLDGVLYAGPVADLASAILAGSLILREMRGLEKALAPAAAN